MSTTAEGFVEEFAGDTGRGTGRGMLGNEDGIRDGSLELGQIRNHRVKSLWAEVRTQLPQVAPLVRPPPLKARHQVAESLQAAVEPALTCGRAPRADDLGWHSFLVTGASAQK